MVSEVVVFVLLYSICCSIIEDRVCVLGVCFCCDISTEIPHRIFVVVEGVDDYNENKQQQQQQQRPVTRAGPTAAPTTSSVDVAAITTAISTAMLEHNKSLERIENKLDDMASVTMRMSEAILDFSSSLLSDLKIKYVVHAS